MHSMSQLFRNLFVAAHGSLPKEMGPELTMHDALRICAAGGPLPAPDRFTNQSSPTVRVMSQTTAQRCLGTPANLSDESNDNKCNCFNLSVWTYRSNVELRRLWRQMDEQTPPTVTLTVILVLGECLQGRLRDLVRRQMGNDRLVLMPQSGHWPGTDSYGDLAVAAPTLGWREIGLSRDLVRTLGDARIADNKHSSLLIVPAV